MKTRQAKPCMNLPRMQPSSGLVAGCPAYATGLADRLNVGIIDYRTNPAGPSRLTCRIPRYSWVPARHRTNAVNSRLSIGPNGLYNFL